MATPSTPAPDDRDQLRAQWLQQAAAVFDLYFQPAQGSPPVTFTQREERVCTLTRELAAWLLEQDLAQDPAVRPADPQGPACPKCGRAARRRTPPGTPLPRRQLTSTAGEITLRREQWHCTTCRVAFFPPGPAAATGHGGV